MVGRVAILGCLSNSNLYIFVSSEFLNKFAISVILLSCLGTSLIFPPWTDIVAVCLVGLYASRVGG